MRRGWGRVALRTVWLLVGAAIGLAAVLLLIGLAQVLGGPPGVVIPLCLLPAVLIGLVPGVRELEVTAARSLLRLTGDLVLPAAPAPAHRLRTVLLVTFHLVAGLTTGVLLVGVVPGTILLMVASVRGRTEQLSELRLTPRPPVLAVTLGLVALGACVLGAWALGRLAGVVTARLLGPTTGDQLEVALVRLAAESRQVRLARELHDGIGHALTIISVQAEAGRRALAREPAQAGSALGAISTTARAALGELDGMLGMLRDDDVSPAEPDLDALPALVEAHRAAGLRVESVLTPGAPLGGLPRPISTTAYRVVAEGLANAQRYAGSGTVRVEVRRDPAALLVTAVSPMRRRRDLRSVGSGRGLAGLRERVGLFGGTVTAGPDGSTSEWVLRAQIPLGAERG